MQGTKTLEMKKGRLDKRRKKKQDNLVIITCKIYINII